jgi:hypothetical protein
MNERVLRDDPGSLLFHLDKHLIMGVQHRRPDLFYLHAAEVAFGGRAAIVAAPAGTGKSTLTFALLQQGGVYLSDELAPIDIKLAAVHPYPRAICFKSPLSQPYALPVGTLKCSTRHYLPTALLSSVQTAPIQVGAIFFLERTPDGPVCEPMSAAAAGAHILTNLLNSLAHPGWGLNAAATFSERVPSYRLNSSDLRRACGSVIDIIETFRSVASTPPGDAPFARRGRFGKLQGSPDRAAALALSRMGDVAATDICRSSRRVGQ